LGKSSLSMVLLCIAPYSSVQTFSLIYSTGSPSGSGYSSLDVSVETSEDTCDVSVELFSLTFPFVHPAKEEVNEAIINMMLNNFNFFISTSIFTLDNLLKLYNKNPRLSIEFV